MGICELSRRQPGPNEQAPKIAAPAPIRTLARAHVFLYEEQPKKNSGVPGDHDERHARAEA